MAAPTRSAMRLLSPRLQHLHQPHPSALRHQLRHASSRYSNPAKRNFTAAPAAQPDFISTPEILANAQPVHDQRQAFLDDRAAWEAKRQRALNRMRFAGMGMILSLAAMAMIVYNLDLDDMDKAEQQRREREQGQGWGRKSGQHLDASNEANERFQGKEVHIIGAGEGKRIVAQGQGEEVELVETGTSSVPHFPKTIYLPTTSSSSNQSGGAQPNVASNPGNLENQEQYTLVGLGIRTVMWIQVYVVGLYVRTQDLSVLQEKLIKSVNPIASTLVPSEKDNLRQKLLDPAGSRELWNQLLQTPGIKSAWRVSPTRNTDFGHLRDGFVTGIQKRTQEAKQLLGASEADSGSASGYDSEEFGQAVATFKGIFQGGQARKGSILLMCRDSDGALDVLFQPKPEAGQGAEKAVEKLGSVSDERIGRLIWLGYLAGEKVSSEPTRKGVAEGCVEFAGRPIGSAETMVA